MFIWIVQRQCLLSYSITMMKDMCFESLSFNRLGCWFGVVISGFIIHIFLVKYTLKKAKQKDLKFRYANCVMVQKSACKCKLTNGHVHFRCCVSWTILMMNWTLYRFLLLGGLFPDSCLVSVSLYAWLCSLYDVARIVNALCWWTVSGVYLSASYASMQNILYLISWLDGMEICWSRDEK